MNSNSGKNKIGKEKKFKLSSWISLAVSLVLICIACVFMLSAGDKVAGANLTGNEKIRNADELSDLLLSLGGEDDESVKKYTSACFLQTGGSVSTNIEYHYNARYPNPHPELPYRIQTAYRGGKSVEFEKQFLPMYYLTGATITKTSLERQMDYRFTEDASYYDTTYVLTTTVIELEMNWSWYTHEDEKFGTCINHYNCEHYYISDDHGVAQGFYCTRYQDEGMWNAFFDGRSWFEDQRWGEVVFESYEKRYPTGNNDIKVTSVKVSTTTMDAEIYLSNQLFAQKINQYTLDEKTYKEGELESWDMSSEAAETDIGKWMGSALQLDNLEEDHPLKELVQYYQQVNGANYAAWTTVGEYLSQNALFTKSGNVYVLKEESRATFCKEFLNSFEGIYRLDDSSIDGVMIANLGDKTAPNVKLSFGMEEKQFVLTEDSELNLYHYNDVSLLRQGFKGAYYILYDELQSITISNINNTTIQQPDDVILVENLIGE